MAAKKVSPTAAFIDEHGSEGVISAAQLAELVNRDGKTVRGYLRKIAARNQAELKGARWNINVTVAETAVEHYAKLDERAEETA